MMNLQAREYIRKLQLKKHPEGGYFREIYRSGDMINLDKLPSRFKSSRVFSTSIYFLLKGNQVSHFHKLNSDETWHFYDGSSLLIHIINFKGKLEQKRLGSDLNNKEQFQHTINSGQWFAAELIDKKSFALVGCTVSPGFDFEDFEMGKRQNMLKMYPEFSELINRLTLP